MNTNSSTNIQNNVKLYRTMQANSHVKIYRTISMLLCENIQNNANKYTGQCSQIDWRKNTRIMWNNMRYWSRKNSQVPRPRNPWLRKQGCMALSPLKLKKRTKKKTFKYPGHAVWGCDHCGLTFVAVEKRQLSKSPPPVFIPLLFYLGIFLYLFIIQIHIFSFWPCVIPNLVGLIVLLSEDLRGPTLEDRVILF